MNISDKRRNAYLAALKEGATIPLALAQSRLSAAELASWRENLKFRVEEAEYAGEQPMGTAVAKMLYLDALIAYRGNGSAARDIAGLKKRDVEEIKRTDSAFAERETEIYEAIGDRIEQTALEGAENGKDLNHTMKVLGKLRKDRWGEEARKIDHRHHGTIALKPIAEQIAELETDDGLDLLQPPE